MQIDLAKLHRLDEAARKEHLHLMDITDRQRAAREHHQKLLLSLEIQLKSLNPFLITFLRESGGDPVKFSQLLKKEGIDPDSLKATVDILRDMEPHRLEAVRLASEQDAQAERWQQQSACLPVLRAFAAKYGYRRQGGNIEVRG